MSAEMAYKQWHSSSNKHIWVQILISDTILQEKEPGFSREMGDSRIGAVNVQHEPRAYFSNIK